MLREVQTYYCIEKNNFPVSNKLFNVDSERAWECVNGEYFPEKNWKREDQITDLALACLLYLASIRNNPLKSPFTQNQLSILKKCDSWENITIGSMFILAYVANSLFLATVPFLSLIPSRNSTDAMNSTNSASQEPYFSPLQLAFIYATFGVIVNFFSTWSTGTAPDQSSNKFNVKQDALLGMEKTYADLAKRLILFYNESKDEAEDIASKIDVDDLKKQISTKIQDKARGERMLERLRDAVVYINSRGTLIPKEDARFCLFIEKTARRKLKQMQQI